MRTPVAIASLLICAVLAGCQSNGAKSSQNPQTQASRAPVAASGGANGALTAATPFTEADEQSIRDQVEQNWNLGSLSGLPDLAEMVVQLRVELLPDGTVTKVEVENEQPGNATFRQVADSAVRAIRISSPLKLPPGARFSVMHLRFHPGKVIE